MTYVPTWKKNPYKDHYFTVSFALFRADITPLSELSIPERYVLLNLMTHEDGYRNPSFLVRSTGLSRRRVTELLHSLHGKGWCKKTKTGREVLYSPNMEKILEIHRSQREHERNIAH